MEETEKLTELQIAQQALDDCDVPTAIEALLLASGEPVAFAKLAEIFTRPEDLILEAIEKLKTKYQSADFGFELRVVNNGAQLRTRSQFAPFIKALTDAKPKRLTGAALETLAIIAYRQPIVKSDIETIRGVDATPTIKTLMDRKLINITGYQSTVGNPALYGTTDNFLKIFGLASLADLPSIRELKELEQDPGETAEEYENDFTPEALSTEASEAMEQYQAESEN